MKRLVLAEKPSVGRDIARVLGCKKETHSYIEGNDYIVTWALGHLVSLADPEQYGKEYKEWNMDVLPMMPKHWKLTVLKKTSKQFQTVKKLLLRNDIKDVIIATDAGREGELVARWILQMSGNKKPIYRLWISSVTQKPERAQNRTGSPAAIFRPYAPVPNRAISAASATCGSPARRHRSAGRKSAI